MYEGKIALHFSVKVIEVEVEKEIELESADLHVKCSFAN